MTHTAFLQVVQTSGHRVKVGGNQSFALTQPESAWYIVRGYVDVFSVACQQGQPSGARFYLFSAGEGELLFGTGSGQSDDERCLIAVPSTDAEIVITGIGKIREWCRQGEYSDSLVMLLEQWIGHLSHGISKDISPRTDLMMEPGAVDTLKADLKVKSRKGITWIEFLSGNALFLGMKEIRITGEGVKFPVSGDSWLQTTEPSDVRSFSTVDIFSENDFWDHLEHFHQIIIYCDYFNTRLITVDEFNRLNEKTAHDSRMRSSALFGIASVIDGRLRKSYFDPGQDSLLTACRFVAGHAGITVTAPQRPKGDEVFPLTLRDILRSSRYRARKVNLTGDWWCNDNGPLLTFRKEGNLPVALIPKSPGKYEYISPGENLRQPLTKESASQLTGEAHQFYRPFPDHPIKGLHLIQFGLKSCVRDILVMIFAGLAGGGLTILVPMLTGILFERVIPQSDYDQLYLYSLVLLFSILAVSVFSLIRSFAMIRIETRLDFSLQSALWDRLLNLSVPFFRKFQAGELAAKANSIMVLRKILSDTVIYSVLGSVFMVFNLILMFFYDATLSCYILGFLTLSFLIVFFIGKMIQKRQRVLIHLQNRISGMLIQFFSSISKIRIAGAEVQVFAQWATKYAADKHQTYEIRKLFMTITLLSTGLPLVIILFVFGVLTGQLPDTLSTGEFLAFYTALTITVVAFLQIAMACISFFLAIPLLENILPILQAMPENVSLKPEIRDLSGEIEVVNVSFRYQHEGPLILDNVSMHVRPGEFVAIVGASGSGKSTLLRLLLGFESPESGSVYYDRQDLSAFDPSSVRRQAGTVLQQAQLSPGNILSNITGETGATFEDAWEVARKVGLEEDIRQMPMGMYTVITGGVSTLSGGQRQRILIARAMVNKPRILFFDEATSALDNKTQQAVGENLEKLQATRIVIAHRLSTVQHADRIFLMEHGKIVASGTYAELLDNSSTFTELVRRQMIE